MMEFNEDSACGSPGRAGCLLSQLGNGAALSDDAKCAECGQSVCDLEQQFDLIGSRLRQTQDTVNLDAACLRLIEQQVAQGGAPFESTHPTTPLEIGPYKIRELLGRGGMGAVYRATHGRLKKNVAIKLLPNHSFSSSTAVARFEREMEAVGKLEHPNVVRAMDAGESNGNSFLIMELLEGSDLGRVVSNGKHLSVADACEVTRQAAIGLQYAHDMGLIHRDVKPSNLMLAKDINDTPIVKVMDLGLALLDEQTASVPLTDQGQLMGTLEFMAPEQASNATQVTHHCDIYALGATLFRLLTGSVPFYGSKYNTPVKRLSGLSNENAPSIGSRQPNLPADLVDLVDRMLSRKPTDRPASMNEVADALADFSAEHDLHTVIETATETKRLQSKSKTLFGNALLGDTSPTGQPTRAIASRQLAVDESATRTTSRKLIGLISAAGILVILLSGLIWLKVNDGTYVRIDAEPSVDVSVAILKNGSPFKTVQLRNDSKEFWLQTGQYEIRLPATEQDSLTISGNSFRVTRNSRHRVTVTHVTADQHRKQTTDASAAPIASAKASDDRLRQLRRPQLPSKPAAHQPSPTIAVVPFDADRAAKHQQAWAEYWGVPTEYENSIGMKFRLIPPGEFLMGSPQQEHETAMATATQPRPSQMNLDNEATLIASEFPQRQVRLTQPYYISTFEVRESDYDQFVDRGRPTAYHSPDHPIGFVSWMRCAQFCNALNKHEGLPPRYNIVDKHNIDVLPQEQGYRLPTEAEWEFACRSGASTQFPFGNDAKSCKEYAVYGLQPEKQKHHSANPVGQLKPNAFGMFDMLGNHWEWVEDSHFESRTISEPWINPLFHDRSSRFRIARGGFVLSIPEDLRTARRRRHITYMPYPNAGFRIVLSLNSELDPSTLNPNPHPWSDEVSLKDTDIREIAKWAIAHNGWVGSAGRIIKSLDQIPTAISRIDLIEVKRCDAKELNQLLRWLDTTATCTRLFFVNCKLTEENVALIAQQTQLVQLSITSPIMTDQHLEAFAKLPKLVNLVINNSQVTRNGIEQLVENCRQLKILGLHSETLNSEDLTPLSRLPNLVNLSLSLPLTSLESLAGSSVSDLTIRTAWETEFATQIKQFPAIAGLHLHDCKTLTDANLATFAEIPTLKNLWIHQQQSISADGILSLTALRPDMCIYLESELSESPLLKNLMQINPVREDVNRIHATPVPQ